MQTAMTDIRASLAVPSSHVTAAPRVAAMLPRPAFAGRRVVLPPTMAPAMRSQRSVSVQARQTGNRAVEGAKRAAEGDAYGKQDGGGNGAAYLANALVSAAAAAVFILSPETASGVLFGPEAGNYENIIFRILGLGFLTAGTINWTQEAATKSGYLKEVVHRRMDASLSFFAAANLFITAISFIPNPNLYPRPPLAPWGAAALGAVAVFQWLVSGRNYAKYSEEGANPVAILKSYFRDLSTLGQIDGINSGIYSLLTASFVLAGFGYIFAPAQTLDLAFGTMQPKTIQDIFSWQLAGAGVATLVGPVAFTQKEAAMENNFSRPDKRTLMAGLASASLGHLLILTPLLSTANSGPATLPLLSTWALSAAASSYIAIKPSED